MCSIIGSYSKDKIVELCELNAYRGQQSHSVSYYDIKRSNISIKRGAGAVDYDKIQIPLGFYCIVHMQAPTTQEVKTIHPAYFEGNYLWHNGIIKQKDVARLKEEYQELTDWDTFLLLKSYYCDNTNALDKIDGTFSCLMYGNDGVLRLFRNQISPMFYDKDLNISSTKFEGSDPTPHDTIIILDLQQNNLVGAAKFKTFENPYFFAE